MWKRRILELVRSTPACAIWSVNASRSVMKLTISQSMRNNLIFFGIAEDNSTGSETPAVTELKFRDFLHEKMKIARETVEALRL
ncbi:hypothetical protein DPMN_029245 [Dreissena polymorpha]|uniref:Uncharacterized protein n=1 Tax=Dreissena polymorpha TaxID=45954 RepID=A0A9D4RG25_DREPO|nr:hypothetical protein DPMN_029245 [Dreissena polymorpha]